MLGGRRFGMARAPPVALLLVTAGRGPEADAAAAPAARLIGVPTIRPLPASGAGRSGLVARARGGSTIGAGFSTTGGGSATRA